MNDVKSILASKTVWGAIVAIAAGVLAIWHYNITPDDQASLVDLLAGLGGTGGGVIAIIGRIVASKTVTVTGK